MLDDARRGQGGALRIDGAPGVGKSALLRSIVPDDLPCLTTTGTEAETALPLAGLEHLLQPLLTDGDATLHASDPAELLRTVSARIAAAAPLVVLVDDTQWLDPSSRDAVAFLARRADRLGIALIAVWSVRGSAPPTWPDVPVLPLDELEPEAAVALAREGGLAPAVAEALVHAIGGNPLALTEAPRRLTAAQRAGRALLPEPLPVGDRLQQTFADRSAALPARAREALLHAAAGAPAALVADELGPAEDAELVDLTPAGPGSAPGVRFRHPIVRSAVYHGASASARRAAHRWVAERTEEPERSWQQALAATAPDDALAGRLEAFADATLQRGAPGTAAAIHARATHLTADPALAVGRAAKAATAAALAGQPLRARGVLDAVLPTVTAPAPRADLQLLRGMALHQSGAAREARRLLEAEADAIAPTDPGRATALLIQACIALMGSGPMADLTATARRAVELAPPGAEVIPGVILAEAAVNTSDHERGRRLLAAYADQLLAWDPTGPGYEVQAIAGLCWVWLGEHATARRQLERIVDANRATGAVIPLALPLAILAALHVRLGDLGQAAAYVEEATEIAETGLGLGASAALVQTAAALVAAHRGDERTCRTTADRLLSTARPDELPATLAGAEHALGHLALSSGDATTAARHYERALAHAAAHGTTDPAFLFTPGDAVEALLRAGRPAEAARVLDELAAGAARTGGTWARAATHRGRALLGPAATVDAELQAALALHREQPMPFEEARTRLAVGERLRRERRRSDARELLTAAAEAFAAMGARRWASRAARELAATGSAPGAGVPLREDRPDPLTAREHDVCELVAAGRTNREVAATLFLSPRTVEHHLRSAYRKLDVRSRTELAAHYAARMEPGQPS